MDDLKALYEAWESPEAPSHAASARARAALLARANGRVSPRRGLRLPLPRLGVRLAAVCVSAMTIAIGVAVVENLTGADGRQTSIVPGLVPAANAAQVLERAAVAAEKKSFIAPRPNQWIYFEDRYSSYGPGGRLLDEGVQRSWHRADGLALAFIDEHGQLRVREEERPRKRLGRPVPTFGSYRELAALPADPNALLRWAYEQNLENGDDSRDAVVYLLFKHILRENVLPPELEAATFRALKQVPGVTLTDTVDVSGRPAFALGQTEDWLHQELLLDKQTYTYRGERSTVVKDATIDPLKAGNSTGDVKKGSRVVVARVATAIVDEPGRRP
jgi:hypothetical protein